MAACSNTHSAMSPEGPRAQRIAHLMLAFWSVSAVVYLTVIAVLIWALLRRRRSGLPEDHRPASESRAQLVITGAVAVTVVTLIALALAEFFTDRFLNHHPEDSLRVVLTGHQYWWEVQYDDPVPSRRLRTANEFHIPVGKPVELVLTSGDVIHSFWLPSLSGKKDLIPGHTNTEVIQADKPGIYTGQCAEFCGLQHAQMRLVVHAEPPEQFEQWKQQQLQPARPPATESERRGQTVFLSSSCILCHSIQGTDAGGTVAPDLTHVASRRWIAAGTLPNTQSNLASWVLAPYRVKPGAMMPATPLPPQDLAALTSYLASLQ
jgi:cytochrome c oxidase subunit 2